MATLWPPNGQKEHALALDDITEQALLRAVLSWVGRAYPGCVARLEVVVQHHSRPLLWEAAAVLSNRRRYRFTLALVSARIAVCLGAPVPIVGSRCALWASDTGQPLDHPAERDLPALWQDG